MTAAVPRAVTWGEGRRSVRLLDQTLLPGEERYLDLRSAEEVAEAIRMLRVRGAPAIGIAAALGLAVEVRRRVEEAGLQDPGDLREVLDRARERLLATRPTGRNLGWALERMVRAAEGVEEQGAEALVEALQAEAEAVAREDEALCRRIGEHGLGLIPESGASVLTHCNAGALATGGIGTALAPVYLAREAGVPLRVFACETRPVLQGARLTAWELERAGVDVTLVTDSMAAALMGRGEVDLVLVGADRVAADGSVANKIGTYGLAVLAHHHGLPFYVAAPRSTFDPETREGRDIPVEVRPAEEVREAGGRCVAPPGVQVWNPAFDVTPPSLVTALLTDGGILRPPYGPAIRRFLASDSTEKGPS